MDSLNKLGILILAGGKSSRMGFPKPWLTTSENISFLEHIIKQYAKIGFKRIVVVLNEEFYNPRWKIQIQNVKRNAIIIRNKQVDKGRLFSIKSGLEKLNDLNYVFIQNVDNPFVDFEIIEKIYKNACQKGVTVPVMKGRGGHPVLISKSIGLYILKKNNDLTMTLRDVLSRFDRTNVEVENENIFKNINSPSDYKKMINESV